MKAVIYPSSVSGKVSAPPSKSYTHRAIICGLLATGTSVIENPLFCTDTKATLAIAKMMGANVSYGTDIEITGPENLVAPSKEMNCKASGTTLRIFTAISPLADGRCTLTGDKSLLQRPIAPLVDALQQLGIDAQCLGKEGTPPVEVVGNRNTKGTDVVIPGNISSQFITGLLFLCSKLDGASRIKITETLESTPYIEMTISTMNSFGANATPSSDWQEILVQGNQKYHPATYSVEGDYSSSAFLLAAGALAGEIMVTNLERNTLQGDVKFLHFLKRMGAKIAFIEGDVCVETANLTAQTIDVSNTPDLVPVLAVLASQASGTTKIVNAARLRFKESDRLAAIAKELGKLGADIRVKDDSIEITGPTPLEGGIVDPHNDHRIAMAGALAGLVSKFPVVVDNIECVRKSYPNFVRDFRKVGAQIELVDSDKEKI